MGVNVAEHGPDGDLRFGCCRRCHWPSGRGRCGLRFVYPARGHRAAARLHDLAGQLLKGFADNGLAERPEALLHLEVIEEGLDGLDPGGDGAFLK